MHPAKKPWRTSTFGWESLCYVVLFYLMLNTLGLLMPLLDSGQIQAGWQ